MGIFAKIKKAWFDTIVWETIDDEFYDELEDSLIMADLGATVAHDAVKKLLGGGIVAQTREATGGIGGAGTGGSRYVGLAGTMGHGFFREPIDQ